ncbi:MAG: TRAP transporter large permease [Thiotrichaceae bacterium]|nr:TRAP transporter large permease [Thiotrichaceae bacterium]
MDYLLFAVFAVLLLGGVPMAVALGLAGTLLVALNGLGMMSLPINVYTGIAKYPLLAIPMFILAGLIFERSGVALRLVNLAVALVGNRRGGLAIAAITVCMVLGGISGSGPADAAAIATVMIPSMLKAGYPKAFSASVIAAAGSTAILIPPSIAFILYSILVPQASIPSLFAAGLIPGLLAGLSLVIPAWYLSRKHHFGIASAENIPKLWDSFKQAGWGLITPIIILGGILSGAFTPTEAAVIAVFYGLFVGMVVYRSLSWQQVYEVLVESAEISATVLLIIALASVFAWAGSTLGTFDHLAQWLIGTDGKANETVVLLNITGLILIAGMFLDGVSIFFIFLPLLIPIAKVFNWDLVWFGVILTMNIAIGQFTPPMAINLMVTSKIGGIRVESTVPWVLWMVLSMSACLLLVTFVPELTLFLPRYLGY